MHLPADGARSGDDLLPLPPAVSAGGDAAGAEPGGTADPGAAETPLEPFSVPGHVARPVPADAPWDALGRAVDDALSRAAESAARSDADTGGAEAASLGPDAAGGMAAFAGGTEPPASTPVPEPEDALPFDLTAEAGYPLDAGADDALPFDAEPEAALPEPDDDDTALPFDTVSLDAAEVGAEEVGLELDGFMPDDDLAAAFGASDNASALPDGELEYDAGLGYDVDLDLEPAVAQDAEPEPMATPAATGLLAERLEALAARLRLEGPGALEDALRSNDRAEAILAAALAGLQKAGVFEPAP